MRRSILPLAAATALFLCPILADSLAAQAGQGGQAPAGGAPGGRGAAAPQGGADQGPGRQGGGRAGGRGGRGGRAAGPPPGPAPRNSAGRVLLNGLTGKDTGVWTPNFGINTPLAPVDDVPFHDWSRALYVDRQAHELEPHARCKASGVSRQFMTPYGVEFVEIPELRRIYIFDIGGPHTYRTVYMDGRTHPESPTPTSYGHSIGWWEGDTLVIETTGFNEDFWLDRRGMPHTEQLRTLERFTRSDETTIQYEATIDDPGAYTGPWSGNFTLRWNPGQELFEYVCQQANYAGELMVGDMDKVDRSSSIIP